MIYFIVFSLHIIIRRRHTAEELVHSVVLLKMSTKGTVQSNVELGYGGNSKKLIDLLVVAVTEL